MIRRKSQTFIGWWYNDINLIVLVYTELSFDVKITKINTKSGKINASVYVQDL